MHDYMIEENEMIGLHDCRTNRIRYDDNIMVFEFPNGFYRLSGREAEQTGKAEMHCHILDEEIDGITVYIYREEPSGKVVREDWSDNFMSAVNDGAFEFEFVTSYRSYQHILFKGYVWFDTPPYHMECEAELHTDKIFYSWTER
ncbi:MAG: hypothetical protein IJF53_07160 [Clostridia bacterium]|nr:hypothetical protein [Clostridia bacterium]